MKLTIPKLRDLLKSRLSNPNYVIVFDREKDTIRVEHKKTKKGITVSLPPIIAKAETKGEKAIEEIIYYIEEALQAMSGEHNLSGAEKKIFPVIRSTSFPTKADENSNLIYDDHTAETRIYYAIDLGNSYRLIDDKLLAKENWDKKTIREIAKFNIRSLPYSFKKDTVMDNDFYFLNTNDGYDASRILNETILKEMEEKVEGKLVISIPHQDVIIFADIKNQTGYDILAQMSMSFFASGRIPITSLSFYYENGKLEPIFILAKNRPNRKE